MQVTQISIGRFHHFHLARQMELHGLLNGIWTGYPQSMLKDEAGIPIKKIHTFPWLQAPYLFNRKYGVLNWPWLNKEWAWWAQETLDRHVSHHLDHPTALIALSGTGLHAGLASQKMGGYHICDRGSSHIQFQNKILKEEYARWGLVFPGIDNRTLEKEEMEYALADYVTVPSTFVKRSFIEMGVPEEKIIKIPYGARLDRFKKVTDPPENKFIVLWVGAVNLRKGFFDLLAAFKLLKHPGKELLVIGSIAPEVKSLLNSSDLENVEFKGNVPNKDLPLCYSTAHVFVIASIEEGLAMVQGEALACGCPVIATTNTGGEDLFDDGIEGFIVPIRSPNIILERLQQLADDNKLRTTMSEAALQKVKSLGGWDNYGRGFANLVKNLK